MAASMIAIRNLDVMANIAVVKFYFVSDFIIFDVVIYFFYIL